MLDAGTVRRPALLTVRSVVASVHLPRRQDYTHIVAIGGYEPAQLLSALARYTAGGTGYVDPVAFEDVFEVTDGVPTLTFAPMIRVSGSGVFCGTRRHIMGGIRGPHCLLDALWAWLGDLTGPRTVIVAERSVPGASIFTEHNLHARVK